MVWRKICSVVMIALLSTAYLMAAGEPAAAVQPGEQLSDPKLEARARKLSAQLRCLVCQNQSIDDSNAPLAQDLRILVRERLQTGASDKDVMDFIVARYGEFVLLKPRFGIHTLALWMAPLLILLVVGLFIFARVGRRRGGGQTSEALSSDEEAELKRLLEEK